MKLDQAIEKPGFFWLPETPDTKSPGTLRIDETGRVTVEIMGFLGDQLFEPQDLNEQLSGGRLSDKGQARRILGLLQGGESVTLETCVESELNFSGSGLSLGTFHANFALMGILYDEGEPIEFSELGVSLEGLDSWLGISGINFEQDLKSVRGAVHFQLPDAITLNLSEDLKLEFSFGLSFPSVSFPITEGRVSQTTSAMFSRRTPCAVREFIVLATRLRNFIELGLDQPISVTGITAYAREQLENGDTYSFPIKIYGRYFISPQSTGEIHRFRALFTYRDIADRLEEHLKEWYEKYEELEPAFNLFFASKFGGLLYLDVRFLWLAQASEVLHRRTDAATAMPEEEFEGLVDQLLLACPENRQEWLRRRLTHANEVSFRNRVKALTEPFADFFPNRRSSESFVNSVVEIRNQLTHHGTQGSPQDNSLDDLWKMAQKLEAVFQLNLLKLIGLDYRQFVERNVEITRKLSL